MQTIMDAASHIAEEIERTRLHLANLEQALAGLKPLMTIDVSTTTLFYSQVDEAQPVEDAFIVQEAKTQSKAAKPRKAQPVQAETVTATATAPSSAKTTQKMPKAALPEAMPASFPPTGAEFWMKAVGRKAFSSGALTDAALKKLSLDASAKAVMANRARAWITASLKKGALVAAGMRNGIHFYKLA